MTTTPMELVIKVGRFQLFRAKGKHFLHEGYHLWTGKRHVQLWPLSRLGKVVD